MLMRLKQRKIKVTYDKKLTTTSLRIAVVSFIFIRFIRTSLRPQNEIPNNENKIFSILSSARARTNVTLAGKYDSHRHSTTSISENVVVAGTSYQM